MTGSEPPEKKNGKSSPEKSIATILMVDDDQNILTVFEDYLTAKGYSFIPVRDPRIFLQKIKTVNPDIIFMDIKLRSMRGEDVIKVLRKRGVTTPIVVISGFINKNLITGLKGCSVSGYLAKPVDFNKLGKMIHAILEEKKRSKAVLSIAKQAGLLSNKQRSLLLITENKMLKEDPSGFFPKGVVEKCRYSMIVKSGLYDSITTLKDKKNNIQVIMIDAANEAKTLIMTKLLRVTANNLSIPVYFSAGSFSRRFRDFLEELGFENLIARSECSPQELTGVFESALSDVDDSARKKAAGKKHAIIKDLKAIKSLPPMPSIFIQIEKLARNPNATTAQYGSILELDPGITARILRMSNSAIYPFKRKIMSVKDAVALMGTREILSLVRLACVTGNLKAPPEAERAIRDIWEHSAACSITARLLYEETAFSQTKELEDDLFICGILHDIGKIILWKYYTNIYMSFMLNPAVSNYPSISDEEKHLGTTHVKVGKAIADYWQLPESIGDVIGYHHSPMLKQGSDLVKIIHLANVICQGIMYEFPEGQKPKPEPELLEKTGMTESQLDKLSEKLAPQITKNTKLITRTLTG